MDYARANDPNDKATIQRIQAQIDEMGGREEYQRASQLSTKFHSTSRWVLKVLGQMGWTSGIDIRVPANGDCKDGKRKNSKGNDNDNDECAATNGVQKMSNRPTRILEVGAINTELLDASKRTTRVKKKIEKSDSKLTHHPPQQYENVPLYNINVRAIDLRSSYPNIEEMDFLAMPVKNEIMNCGSYDCIVCSMVLNCVTTPEQRGVMLNLLFKQLRPGGLCFLTMPRLCLNQSKFMNRELFEELLTDALGFEIDDDLKRETPKVAFWVLRRPMDGNNDDGNGNGNGTGTTRACALNRKMGHPGKIKAQKMVNWNEKWETTKLINRGQKYRNFFAVSLKENEVLGRSSG